MSFPNELRLALVDHIKTTHPDPATWLRAIRDVCELVGIDPAKAIDLPTTLDHAAHKVVWFAHKLDRIDELKEAMQ